VQSIESGDGYAFVSDKYVSTARISSKKQLSASLVDDETFKKLAFERVRHTSKLLLARSKRQFC
jgi:hypothetical protein